MRRFYVEKIDAPHGAISITGSEARHMTKVLRMKRGESFILMDGTGGRYLASIRSVRPQEVCVTLKKALPAPPPSPVEIILCQALLKSRAMDFLIQKTSELGVDRIIPFSSERTLIKLDQNRTGNRVRHWKEIAASAAKQSSRRLPARIEPPISFEALIVKWKTTDATKVLLWEEEKATDLKHVLRATASPPTFIGLIGPEGGFSHEEAASARNAGFISVTLGHRVLRSETAAVAMVTLVQYERGDLGSLSPAAT